MGWSSLEPFRGGCKEVCWGAAVGKARVVSLLFHHF